MKSVTELLLKYESQPGELKPEVLRAVEAGLYRALALPRLSPRANRCGETRRRCAMIAPTQRLADDFKRRVLNMLYKRGTCYELTIDDGARAYLLGYATSHSRAAIARVVLKRVPELRTLFGTDPVRVTFGKGEDGRAATFGSWAVRWTGRTHREAIASGLYYADLPEPDGGGR